MALLTYDKGNGKGLGVWGYGVHHGYGVYYSYGAHHVYEVECKFGVCHLMEVHYFRMSEFSE